MRLQSYIAEISSLRLLIAVIKGSCGALKSDLGYLPKETYVEYGHGRSQATSSAQREMVYALFEVYTKRKKLQGHYDPADRWANMTKSPQSY